MLFYYKNIMGVWEMKKKIVERLLMVGLATALAVNIPMVNLAADKSEVVDENKDEIIISKDKSDIVFYKDDKVSISFENGEYTTGASDVVLVLEVKNKYPNILTVNFKDAKVDDSEIKFEWDTDDYKAGAECTSNWYIMLEKLQAINYTDFKKLSFTMTGTLNDGTELFEKQVTIDRDVLKSLEDENEDSSDVQESSTEETNTEEATSNDNDELLQRIGALEEKNKELEDKNKELENKLSESTEEKQEEDATTEQTEESVQEEKTTEVSEPETEQESIVEYKDATTIRIVQQALNEIGYNCGNPDGIAGGKTTEAITKYQTDKGLTVNGLVTDELLQSLNVVEKVQDAVQKEASKSEYSGDYTYDQLARNPDTYKGQKMKFTGKVIEAGNDDDICYARVRLNSNYDTVLFVTYESNLLGYRLLDDDVITIYGTSLGVYSYQSVGAGTITIPWINADMIEM